MPHEQVPFNTADLNDAKPCTQGFAFFYPGIPGRARPGTWRAIGGTHAPVPEFAFFVDGCGVRMTSSTSCWELPGMRYGLMVPIKIRITLITGHERLVTPLLNNLSSFEHDNAVGKVNR